MPFLLGIFKTKSSGCVAEYAIFIKEKLPCSLACVVKDWDDPAVRVMVDTGSNPSPKIDKLAGVMRPFVTEGDLVAAYVAVRENRRPAHIRAGICAKR